MQMEKPKLTHLDILYEAARLVRIFEDLKITDYAFQGKGAYHLHRWAEVLDKDVDPSIITKVPTNDLDVYTKSYKSVDRFYRAFKDDVDTYEKITPKRTDRELDAPVSDLTGVDAHFLRGKGGRDGKGYEGIVQLRAQLSFKDSRRSGVNLNDVEEVDIFAKPGLLEHDMKVRLLSKKQIIRGLKNDFMFFSERAHYDYMALLEMGLGRDEDILNMIYSNETE
jgi:hypothetical protein